METFSALLAICAGNSPVPGEFPTQRPVTRSFDVYLIWVWINGWVNNREAGDLRRYRAHCDVIVMMKRRRLTSVWISSLKIRRSCTTVNLYNGIHTHGKTVFVLECLPVDDWKLTKTMKTNFSVIHIHWVDNASDMATAMWVNIGSSNDLLPDGTKPLPEPILTSP